MKFALCLLLTLAPTVAAEAKDSAQSRGEWYYIGISQQKTITYARTVDLLKANPESTNARVWVKMTHKFDSTIKFRETKFLYEVNCPAQTMKTLSMIAYLPDGTSKSHVPTYAPAEPIAPDTISEAIAKELCSH